MDATQSLDQIGNLALQQYPLAGCAAAGDSRPLEFAFGQGPDLLNLLAQRLPASAILGRQWLLGELGQRGEWGFHGVGQIAKGVTGSPLTLIQQDQQAVQFGDQCRTSSGASAGSCAISPRASCGRFWRICSSGARPRRTICR